MKTTTLRIAVWILIGLVLGCGLGLPHYFLSDWSLLAQLAVSAGGQLLAYTAMAALALCMESRFTDLPHGHDEPPPPQ
jgi:hypothetical protein